MNWEYSLLHPSSTSGPMPASATGCGQAYRTPTNARASFKHPGSRRLRPSYAVKLKGSPLHRLSFNSPIPSPSSSFFASGTPRDWDKSPTAVALNRQLFVDNLCLLGVVENQMDAERGLQLAAGTRSSVRSILGLDRGAIRSCSPRIQDKVSKP